MENEMANKEQIEERLARKKGLEMEKIKLLRHETFRTWQKTVTSSATYEN